MLLHLYIFKTQTFAMIVYAQHTVFITSKCWCINIVIELYFILKRSRFDVNFLLYSTHNKLDFYKTKTYKTQNLTNLLYFIEIKQKLN